MTVRDIVRDYLERHGFDGLAGDDCGCEITDLMPCGELCSECGALRLLVRA
jgi:hypothetical protein